MGKADERSPQRQVSPGPILLTVTGTSTIAASAFSPASDHGAIDVIAVGAATCSYAYLTLSIVLAQPSKLISRWFGGDADACRTERWAFIVSGLTGLLVTLTSAHGIFLIVIAGMSVAALTARTCSAVRTHV